MPETTRSSEHALLASYVNQIADAQRTIQELYVEIGRLKKDARADGFNLEAVHQLGLILAKSPHDGGVGLLTDIVTYADQTGIKLNSILPELNNSNNMHIEDSQKDSFETSHFEPTRQLFSQRLSSFFQLVLGIATSAALIWLLH